MNNIDLSKDYVFLCLFLLIVLCAFILRMFLSKYNPDKINKPLAVLAIYLSAICLILCLTSAKLGIYQIKTLGNPVNTVTVFYDSILGGDYDYAYSVLNNCETLGLENVIAYDDPAADKISDALKKSYSYSVSDNIRISGLNAVVEVSFTYLDVNALKKAIQANIDPILNSKIETMHKDELYTDDGHYQKSLMDTIYIEATDQALKNVTDYYVTVSYDVTLEYHDGKWYMNINDEMIRGFLGGQ